jgi:hypothetical protein
MAAPFELTIFKKADGRPLTKHMALDPAGRIANDNSACRMSRGRAWRFTFNEINALAVFCDTCGPDEALALGCMCANVANDAEVVTKSELNGATPGTIARTKAFLEYREGSPAVALIDFDRKGMAVAVSEKLAELGGVGAALLTVIPGLDKIARIIRRSTSAGIYRIDTGERFAGIGGTHLYVAVRDGRDIIRFLKTLHQRCWLAGLGWYWLGAAGQLLERSIVDRMVGQPERLVFEGPPQLDYPLGQDTASRQAQAIDGELLDTRTACPPLSTVHQSRLERIQAAEKTRLKPEAERVRQTYIVARAQELATDTGMPLREAVKVITEQCGGILRPAIVLPFDDLELEGCTVADVLADPERFADATLADPVEGIAYGPDKAKLFVNGNGVLIIHSFAHGGGNYWLLYDYQTAATALRDAGAADAVEMLKHIIRNSRFDDAETELLRNLVSEITGLGKRTIGNTIKATRQEVAGSGSENWWEEDLVAGAAGRPVLPEPSYKAEGQPVVEQVSEMFDARQWRVPSLREIKRRASLVQLQDLPKLHLLTSEETKKR